MQKSIEELRNPEKGYGYANVDLKTCRGNVHKMRNHFLSNVYKKKYVENTGSF